MPNESATPDMADRPSGGHSRRGAGRSRMKVSQSQATRSGALSEVDGLLGNLRRLAGACEGKAERELAAEIPRARGISENNGREGQI